MSIGYLEGGFSGDLKSLRRDEDEIIVSGSDECHWFDTSSGSTRINTSLLGKKGGKEQILQSFRNSELIRREKKETHRQEETS